MRYVQAMIAVGLFGWLGYAVAFDALPAFEGGSSKTRGLMSLVESVTQSIGSGLTGALLLSIGVVIAWYVLKRGE